MAEKRILLVEDEENLQDVIGMNLRMEGYQVVVVGEGKLALDTFRKERFDLLILDVMLPGMDGFTLCKTIRLENEKIPILFLTAKGNSQDRVEGLKSGADDYLTKPFNLEELLLRVQILLKRLPVQGVQASEINVFEFGRNSIDFKTFEIKDKKGGTKTISKREIKLLKLLIDRNQQVVSREEILETVWGYDVYPSSRTIDNYILAFRKYFEDNPRKPRYFHSIRGVGYKFTA